MQNKNLKLFSFEKFLIVIALLILIPKSDLQSQTKTASDGKYSYEIVENDPLKARIYTLDNGLKVYITVNKEEPRIQTYIAVATGSKNDPHDAQGLSHYLEHMLFKGTDKFGTKDFEKEKPFIDTIIALYEQRRGATDPVQRKEIYHKIDSVSYLASEYSIANEYDKMITAIGGQGSNAYTSVEQTVYVCDIPSNQLDKWLTIEAERFRNPVMRLFHTELEAVYEEKNTDLDNDNNKVWEEFLGGLFQKHTYGTQTTIGSVEQLQNPSVQKIIDYYNENYVPNNMAICLSGDLDPDKAIRLIDEKFGNFKHKEIPEFISPAENVITTPIVKYVTGPSKEYVRFGYRTAGAGTKEAAIITMIEYVLSNGTAGLIDLNLNQDQKVIDAYTSTIIDKDYSIIYFGGTPREGQSLDDVKNLLMSQIELVKKGEFPDWLLPAIISNFKLGQLQSFEKNENRADAFVSSFILGIPWEKYIFNIENNLAKVTKADIVNFAKENLNENYVIVYKTTGEDTSIQKVNKPEINPVKINNDVKSEFVETVLSEKVEDIKPVFMDFKNDVDELQIKNKIPLLYMQNTDNELFNLSFIFDIGTNNDLKLRLAADYINYLGTSRYTPSEIKEEFYKLACSFGISVTDDETIVGLSGLNENFDKALTLLEDLFSDPKANKEALENLIADILKEREDAKLSKRTILWTAMVNYAKYGADNPFTDRLSKDELKKIKPEELISIIKKLFSYRQRVLYFGPENSASLIQTLNEVHKTPAKLKTLPAENKFTERENNKNIVYAVNYDMQQAEIVMLSKSGLYDKSNVPIITLYNEYFGGGMGSIVFQELRESKALAYGAYSGFQIPYKKDKPEYIVAYIGTQADKLPESMAAMTDLLNNIPKAEIIFENSKNSLIKQIQSDRVSKANILSQYEAAKKLGLDYDLRKDIYEKISAYNLNDVIEFQKKFIKNKKYSILVLGDLKELDMKTLEKYGEVKVLTLEEIFGY